MLIMIIFSILALASAQEAFNLEVELPESYAEVPAGENLWFTTKVVNLANQERIDITLTYDILDPTKQMVASKSETMAVETQASFVANINLPKNLKDGLYYLRTTLSSPFGESQAETSFNVAEEEPKAWIIIRFSLFDIDVTIPDDYKQVSPGDELLSSIKLINVGSEGRIDVFLDYEIRGPNGEILLKKKETVAVETQANFVRTFDIPDNTPPGQYTLYAKIIYADGKEAIGEELFEIVEAEKENNGIFIFTFMVILALAGLTYIGIKSRNIIDKIKMRSKVHEMVEEREDKRG